MHRIRHPCTPWYVFFAHFCQSHLLSSLLNKDQKKKKIQTTNCPYAFDKGVTLSTLSTFAAASHQFEISSELTKVAEPGLIGREMANFQQLPGAAQFSSN